MGRNSLLSVVTLEQVVVRLWMLLPNNTQSGLDGAVSNWAVGGVPAHSRGWNEMV